MQHSRLKWICKVIEYDRLTNEESSLLFKFVEHFTEGKLTTITAEEKLEKLFAEVQWREIRKKDLYAIWNKKEIDKGLILPIAASEEVSSAALP